MTILYIRKKDNALTWSDSIKELYHAIQLKVDANIIDLDAIEAGRYLCNKNYSSSVNVICLHHSINFYRLLFSVGILRLIKIRKKIIFFAHEGEPFIRDMKCLIDSFYHPKRLVRFSKLYNKLPYFFCGVTVVLSNIQKKMYPTSVVIHYLKPNDNIFFQRDDALVKKIDILIPADALRVEKKVMDAIKYTPNFSIMHIRNLNNNKLPELINSSKIVLIPSVFETYCLTLLEAMACNAVIVSRSTIGVVVDLLSIYDEIFLNSVGLFIFRKFDDLPSILEIAFRFQLNEKSFTKKLYDNFFIDYSSKIKRIMLDANKA